MTEIPMENMIKLYISGMRFAVVYRQNGKVIEREGVMKKYNAIPEDYFDPQNYVYSYEIPFEEAKEDK